MRKSSKSDAVDVIAPGLADQRDRDCPAPAVLGIIIHRWVIYDWGGGISLFVDLVTALCVLQDVSTPLSEVKVYYFTVGTILAEFGHFL